MADRYLGVPDARAALLAGLAWASLLTGCGQAGVGETPNSRGDANAAAATTTNAANALAEAPPLEAEPLRIEPALADGKERKNLSGAACHGSGLCLLIGDEKRYARYFRLAPGVLAPTESLLHLLPPELPDESDAEGIAFAGGHFYIVGSHSRTKQGAEQASRHFVYRVAADAETGLPTGLGTDQAPSPAVERATLDPIIAAHPLLSRHLTEPPGDNVARSGPSHGVNIEGIAVAGDTMFIGFRGPVDRDGAVILRTRASAVFGSGPASVDTARVRLGVGQGIRDLAAVDGGLLILSGPERRLQVEARPELFFWTWEREPVFLGRLQGRPLPEGEDSYDNPEAIAVLQETADAYRLLVLWDGQSGGVPEIVRVPKRR